MQATLVERNSSGARLTDAGEVLVTHTAAILARMADAEADVRAIGDLRAGQLRLAAFATAATTVAPLAIAAFSRAHPEVKLTSAMVAEPADAFPNLLNGTVDIALSLDRMDDALTAGTDSLWLFDDPMYVALSARHPLAAQRQVSLADLRDDEWLLATTDRRPEKQLFIEACRKAGFEPKLNSYHRHDNYAAAIALVAAGIGISIIPDLAITTRIRDDIVLRGLGSAGPARKVVAATKAGGYRSPATKAMLEILIEASAKWVASRTEYAATGGCIAS